MRTKLIFTSQNGRMLPRIEHAWPGTIEQLGERHHFYDKVLALGELPEPGDWPPILALSEEAKIPSIWRRANPSPLEENAAALLTALAYSGREYWVTLILAFFRALDLEVKLQGRPRAAHPRERIDFVRGIEIDHAKEKLREGFRIKQRAKRKGGFTSDDQEIARALQQKDYDDTEVKALLVATTLQDAACRYYLATKGKALNIELQSVRNSYSRYKKSPWRQKVT
jgi:hypothetical protein